MVISVGTSPCSEPSGSIENDCPNNAKEKSEWSPYELLQHQKQPGYKPKACAKENEVSELQSTFSFDYISHSAYPGELIFDFPSSIDKGLLLSKLLLWVGVKFHIWIKTASSILSRNGYAPAAT